MTIKLRIKELRVDMDYTQQQIAEYLMCDQSLYSKYEREERALPLEFAAKLADFYGVSVDYFLGLTDKQEPYPRKKSREGQKL